MSAARQASTSLRVTYRQSFFLNQIKRKLIYDNYHLSNLKFVCKKLKSNNQTDYDNGTEPVFNQTFQFVVGNQRVIEIIVMNETDEGNVRIGVARFYLASLLNLDFRLAVHLVEPDCGIFSDASHFKGNMAMSLNWKSLNFS